VPSHPDPVAARCLARLDRDRDADPTIVVSTTGRVDASSAAKVDTAGFAAAKLARRPTSTSSAS